MAIIHRTTMTPGKLELLAAWLPAQPWYLDRGREPELARVGGFRLDDPQGEVGIEFMMVTDGSGDQAVGYLVPLTYRSSALADDDSGLIGTSEHGVLGRRWIYDGTRDLVLVAQLVALIQGDAEPQAQSESNTPDPTVTGTPVADGSLTAIESQISGNGPSGTEVRVETVGPDGSRGGQLVIRISRILQLDGGTAADGEAGLPCLFASWRRPDGTPVRGRLATARYTPLVG
jgi:Maltokinase N-terminal cap domain